MIDKIGIALSLLLATLALVGEILGWWGEVGIVLTRFSLVFGAISVIDLYGKRLLDRFGDQGAKMDEMLETQDQMLSKQDAPIGVLERIEYILDDRLPQRVDAKPLGAQFVVPPCAWTTVA